jgi:hypothetical protein
MPRDSADYIDALIDAAVRNYAEPPAELDPRTAAVVILERARQLQCHAIYRQMIPRNRKPRK